MTLHSLSLSDVAPAGRVAAPAARTVVTYPPTEDSQQRTERLSASQRHGSLLVLLALGVVCALDAGILAALLTPIKQSLGLHDQAFGAVAAAFTVAGMAGAPLFGYLAGRFGRKPVLIGAVLLWSLASSAGALTGGVASLVLWRSLTGFGEAAYQGLVPSWLSDLYDQRWRNFVFSLFMVRNKVGGALSLALGAWLASAYDWRIAFLASGVPGLLLALSLLALREPVPGASDGHSVPQRPSRLREQLAVFRVRPYVMHLAALGFFFSGMYTAQMWAPAYLHRVFGLSNGAAAGFMAAVLLFTAPAGLIGGYVFGRTLSRFASGLTVALAVSSLVAAVLFALAFATRDLAAAKLLIVLAVISFGSTAGSLTTLLVETAPAQLRTAAGSFGALVSAGVGGALAPWLLGYLSDRHGLDRAIFLGPAAYALAGLIWTASAISLARTPSSAEGR